MLVASAWVLLGFVLLIWSADRFVYGAAALARNMGIAPLIIGLTIVAMGSSAPEMMVSASAALADKTDTAVGNAIGSNITNILLVLGITALLKPIAVSSDTVKRELPLVLAVSALACWILSDLFFSRSEAICLLVCFVAFIGWLIYLAKRPEQSHDPLVAENEEEIPKDVPTPKAVLWLIVGLILLPLSANLLVENAVVIAKAFGMSDLVIGLTIIAVGTSLPELAASVMSILKKEDDLAIGNIIGSNIFNILAVLSLAGLINPSSVDALAFERDSMVMLGVTGVLLLMALSLKQLRRINRFEGGLLLVGFIAYQVWLLSTLGTQGV